MPPEIRPGRPKDLPALTAIYNHYVLNSNAVFDEAPSTLEQRQEWFSQFAETGPHRIVVAEQEGRVVGWASSQRYRSHPAFHKTIETTIMLSPDRRGRGLGSRLYEALFSAIAGEDLHRVYAGVALPNPASVKLHLRIGFKQIAVYDEYAVKNGSFVSSAWFEKALGETRDSH